jgi:Cu/Ag efflux protein CusF
MKRQRQHEETSMKIQTLLAALAIAVAMDSPPAAAMAQTADDYVDGQVTKVDPSAGKITIKHGPLKKFDMEEGMTMVFRAQDPEALNKVKPGDRIRFVPERINGQFTATKIEKTK